MADSDCIIVHEQVVVPDAVAVKETVSVPVEAQEPPAFVPDPLWPDMNQCPSNEIWVLVTSELGIDAKFTPANVQITTQSYYIDWGDGSEVKKYQANPPKLHYYDNNKCENVDSLGRKFWLLRVFNTQLKYGLFFVGLFGDSTKEYFNGVKYVVFGNGLSFYFQGQISCINLEAIKYLSGNKREIDSYPAFSNNHSAINVKQIIIPDEITVKAMNGYNYYTQISHFGISFDNIKFSSTQSLLGSKFLKGKYDFSKSQMPPANIGLQYFASGGTQIEELILPQSTYEGTSLSQLANDCILLKRLILPPSCRKVTIITALVKNCKSLEELVIPDDLGVDSIEGVNGQYAFLNLSSYRGEIYLPNTRFRCLTIDNNLSCCGVKNVTISIESPFDLTYSGAHFMLRNTMLGHENFVRLFERLPNFSTSSTRIINITGSIGVEELTDEEVKIATDKNWQVIGV